MFRHSVSVLEWENNMFENHVLELLLLGSNLRGI